MILRWIAEAQRAGARLAPACTEVGLDPRTIQRWRARPDGDDRRRGPKSAPANKLPPEEREELKAVANSDEFCDLSPKQIVPILADRDVYLASESTFYRVLREEELITRRGRARGTVYQRPKEKVATGPGQVWSWDITYLRSTIAGEYFFLYLFLDVWSRKIVGYSVHDMECSELATDELLAALESEGLSGVDLVLHSDNGSPMKGATLKATMERLGVQASYSRPHVSDDNPFSESLFRTAKYRPEYPTTPFDSLTDARDWADDFVYWYHHDHLHSGIGFVSPLDRHEGRAEQILAKRRAVYERARQRHPERWGSRPVRTWEHPATVTLNPTKDTRIDIPDHALSA